MAGVSLKVKLSPKPPCGVCYQKDMAQTPFDDLDKFLALPRASGLAVSPDGSRVVTSIAELNDKRTDFEIGRAHV